MYLHICSGSFGETLNLSVCLSVWANAIAVTRRRLFAWKTERQLGNVVGGDMVFYPQRGSSNPPPAPSIPSHQ